MTNFNLIYASWTKYEETTNIASGHEQQQQNGLCPTSSISVLEMCPFVPKQICKIKLQHLGTNNKLRWLASVAWYDCNTFMCEIEQTKDYSSIMKTIM